MTSYPFLKMAAATAIYYFRFPTCWRHCLQKVKVYQQTKFRRDISIGGWDINTSVFEIQTSAILEFYFRFRSRPFCCNWRVILHLVAEFRPNRNIHCRNMTSYRFSRWRPPAMLYLLWVMADHPRSAFRGLNLVLRFGAYFPHMTWPIVLIPNSSWVIWAIQRKNQCDGSIWARDREKNSITKKSRKCYISPIWGRPPLGRFDAKVARWVMSAT